MASIDEFDHVEILMILKTTRKSWTMLVQTMLTNSEKLHFLTLKRSMRQLIVTVSLRSKRIIAVLLDPLMLPTYEFTVESRGEARTFAEVRTNFHIPLYPASPLPVPQVLCIYSEVIVISVRHVGTN